MTQAKNIELIRHLNLPLTDVLFNCPSNTNQPYKPPTRVSFQCLLREVSSGICHHVQISKTIPLKLFCLS